MARFARNMKIWRALAVVCTCSCFAAASPTDLCIKDFNICRYQCPSLQEHCTSTEGDATASKFYGLCCPGFKKINGSGCQVCRHHEYMPDVNNCCDCLPCGECDNVRNDTESSSCKVTRNVVCSIQGDQTTHANSSCPLNDATAESPTVSTEPNYRTAEVNDFNTPGSPLESKWKSMETWFLVIVGPFCFLAILFCVICLVCCCVYLSAGEDQPDMADKTWRDAILIPANKTVSMVRCRSCAGEAEEENSNRAGERNADEAEEENSNRAGERNADGAEEENSNRAGEGDAQGAGAGGIG